MKITKLKIRLSQGELIPKGYGLAYVLYNQDASIYCPIPFNLIARGFIYCYYKVIHGWFPNRWEKKLDITWNAGFKEGERSRQHEIEMLKLRCQIYEDLIINMKKYIGG